MNTILRMSRKSGDIHAFFCAKCGEVAATISIVTSTAPAGVDSDPSAVGKLVWPDLHIPHAQLVRMPHFQLDWLTRFTGPASAAVETLLEAESVDPRELSKIDWELGAFCCRRCEQNYCAKCWRIWPVFDDDGSMWFEEYRGSCPEGHEQSLQD